MMIDSLYLVDNRYLFNLLIQYIKGSDQQSEIRLLISHGVSQAHHVYQVYWCTMKVT
jgi:hypothetical protein